MKGNAVNIVFSVLTCILMKMQTVHSIKPLLDTPARKYDFTHEAGYFILTYASILLLIFSIISAILNHKAKKQFMRSYSRDENE